MTEDDGDGREPWTEGPDEEAPPESWLTLDDDTLLQRIETVEPAEDEDDRLAEVVGSGRHFFIRQEAAKRIKDPRRLYAFEDDRHVGQVFVRHLSRREDLSYLERISMLSRHVEVRQAAQVQLARVWRRLEGSHARELEPEPSPAPVTPVEALRPGAPVEGDEVDASLLGWAAHFLVERAWSHLGTKTTLELLQKSRRDLVSAHPTLRLFEVGRDARVTVDLEPGPRLPRTAVRDLAMWMAAFRRAAREVAPEAASDSVRAGTALMADALRAVGFYTAFEDAETALGL